MTSSLFASALVDRSPAVFVHAEQLVAVLAHERQAEAAAYNRAARLRTARRLQRRAETATRRAQLARLAVQ